MKKTIIALFALAGVAAADSITLTLPGTAQLSPHTEVLGTTCTNIFSTVADDTYGIYYGAQDGIINSLNANEGKWSIGENGGSITMCGRDGFSGSALALVIGADLVAGSAIEKITFSASNKEGRVNMGNSAGPLTLGLAVVDNSGTILKSVSDAQFNLGAAGNSNTATLSFADAITWEDGYKVLAVIEGPQGSGNFGGTAYTIEKISVVATTAAAAPAVPEPTTATMSLLALAGLAARRRRK